MSAVEVMEVEELPCVIEFFSDMWDDMYVCDSVDERVRDYLAEIGWEDMTEEEQEDVDTRDYEESMWDEIWWDPLISNMGIGTRINVGDLMKCGDDIIILLSHPESYGDECWMLNGQLRSTYELIKDDVEEWRCEWQCP